MVSAFKNNNNFIIDTQLFKCFLKKIDITNWIFETPIIYKCAFQAEVSLKKVKQRLENY